MIEIYSKVLVGSSGDWQRQVKFNIKDKQGYTTEFMLFNPTPTKNCQVASFGGLNTLLTSGYKDEEMLDFFKYLYKEFTDFNSGAIKMMYFDVTSAYADRAKKLFGNKLVHDYTFESTNESIITTGLVNFTIED